MSERRRLLQHLDWPLLLSTAALSAIGLYTLASATYRPGETGLSDAVESQAVFMGLGWVGLLLALALDYRIHLRLAWLVYGGVCALLAAVLATGEATKGAVRWLSLGPIHVQPSELAKLALVIALARWFHERERKDGYPLRSMVPPFLLFLVPISALTALEPDLGTVLFYGFIFGTVAFFVGLRIRALAILLVVGALSVPVAYRYALDDYQRDRVETFLDPGLDPQGKGYQTLQSRYAVGSGRLFGKGWRRGTQAQLRFLPEQHTDFIFSVFAEEHGFVGSVGLLGLYLAWLGLGMRALARARERFGAILAAGIVSVHFWQIVTAIAGVLGYMPVSGVTLPLMSYGGSSLVTVLFATGILASISTRRYMF
ncbi:rod shape-determining protein RodA [Myxococcota bacterium]|nr:rod shape-determining protein RodA [Myxococcota bacterium]